MYNFYKIKQPERYSHRTYDGIYYDGKQIIFSKGTTYNHQSADVYVDSLANAIKLVPDGVFKKNKSGRISVSGLNVPKGRYELVTRFDSSDVQDGYVYQLANNLKQEEQ